MISWTKNNNFKLSRLQELIEDISMFSGLDEEEIDKKIYEFKIILQDKTLDLNNEMGILEKPLIIEAAIWYNFEAIKLLLDKNVNLSKTVNFFLLYGNNKEYDYCQNIDKSCLDILYDYKNDVDDDLELSKINECIELIESYIRKKNIKIIQPNLMNETNIFNQELDSLFPY